MVRHAPLVARALGALTVSFLVAGTAAAQIAGENVNMVSGVEWPGGDPFLQRQNEPTIAVSTVNPQHLLAGANDYRSVDIPDPDFGKPVHGDAWLGVFKSLDGGHTWKSFLLAGYPQDPHCQPKPADPAAADPARRRHHKHCDHPSHNLDPAPALCGMPASADPVMRAGTDGMFYYMGINYLRDKSQGRLFVARFLDQNNKEGSDPIQYLDTRVIARSDDPAANLGKAVFIDKPWMAVDVPRGNQSCTVPDPAGGTRTIAAGTIYAAWAQFTANDATSDIMISWSADCGASWVTPRKLNTANSTLNQGVTIAIEPLNGRVFVAWRRLPYGKQTDAIMVTRSEGRRRQFAAPRAIAKLVPFDLGQGSGQARTQTMPSMAIASDGTSSYAHIVWSARSTLSVAGGPGLARLFITSAKIYPRPTGDDDADDPEENDDETRVSWTPAKMLPTEALPADDDAGHFVTQGHQYMPSLTFGQGRLMLAYYDTRYDHTRRYFRPNPGTVDSSTTPPTTTWLPDAKGKFYQEELGPIGDLASPTQAIRDRVFGSKPITGPAPDYALIYTDLWDGSLTWTRHTVDVRVGMSVGISLTPTFSSVLVTRFPYGMRGDEAPVKDANGALGPLTVPAFGGTGPDPDGITVVAAPPAGGTKGELLALQQLQLNPPGYPMFKNGTTAFIGDYLDIQGLNFVPSSRGTWQFNYGFTPAPVFHAAWTSNQDVKVPPNGVDPTKPDYNQPQWTRYTPLTLPWHPAGSKAIWDGNSISSPTISNVTVPACSPETSAFAGTRDQNIYTSRITDGLQVSTPQNSKYLLVNQPVGFVIAAANATGSPMRVAFEAPSFDPSLFIAGDADPGFTYLAGGTLARVEVDIAPRSAVHRTLFVTQAGTDSHRTIHVTVNEVSFDGKSCGTACRSGALTFNAPVALNTLAWSNPATDPNQGEIYLAGVGAPTISNPTISNPTISNPTISNPTISNPTISNPTISNPTISNPTISNPTISNPTISNPTISNPTISNPTISNPTISNSAMADLNYTVTNEGNTTSNYHVKIVAKDPAQLPSPLSLIVSKTYKTPGAVGCELKEVAHDEVVTSVPDINKRPAADGTPRTDLVKPTDPVRPGPGAPTISNATLALAPGESATITLRALVPVADLAKVASEQGVAAAPVAAAVPASTTTTYQDWGSIPGNKPFVKAATTTTLQGLGGGSYTATVTPALATGTVSFILGSRVLALVPLASGTASVTLDVLVPSGQTMVAFYSGDASYAASSSNGVAAAGTPQIRVMMMQDDVQVVLAEQDGVTFIDGATVTFNGLTVPPQGSGGYWLTDLTPLYTPGVIPPGTAVNVVATTTDGRVVTVSGSMPAAPSWLTPTSGSTISGSNPLLIQWSGVADYYNIWAQCTAPLGATCYWSPSTSVIYPQSQLTIPANTFPAVTPVDLWIESRNYLTITGATAWATPRSTAGLATSASLNVAALPTVTAVSWSSSPTSGSGLLGMVDFWVEVTGPAGSTVEPTGTAELHIGASIVPSLTLGLPCRTPTPGRSCTMGWYGRTMSVGPSDVYAIYNPASGSSYASSAAPLSTINVATALPITLASSQNPSAGTTPVTFTASFLVPNDRAAPTGTVSFHEAGGYHILLGTAPLTCGPYLGYHYCAAAWTGVDWTGPGNYGITAAYSGDPSYAGYSRGWATMYQTVLP